MAIIGTIRKHSALAVILVGVAIAAFVLSDLFKPRNRQQQPLGDIAGEEISINDFNKKVDENIEIQKANQNKANLTAEESFNVRNSTWSQFISEILMGREYDALDLSVTTDELFDLVQGQHPHPIIMQYFKDPSTGKFNPQLVINFLQNLDKADPQVKKQWLSLERYIKQDRLSQKYQALVKQAYYVPKAFAEKDYIDKTKAAELRYAAIRYTSIPDSSVTLTDRDYQAYYDENRQMYTQDASRDLDYVIFDVLPSDEDRAKIKQDVFQLYDEFTKTSDVPSFVNAVSDSRYDSTWHVKGQLPVLIDSVAFNSPVGTFVAPYQADNAWHMAKLMDIAFRPDSMKVEHILIAYQGALRANQNVTRTKEQAQAEADSLLAVVKSDPKKLPELALKYSDDGSVKDNKGDLGWFADGSMIYPFNEAAVHGKVGDVLAVETNFGFHVMMITGKKDPVKKVRVAVIDRNIEPSSKTFQDYFTKASTFAGENNTKEKFEKAVADEGLNKRSAPYIKDMANSIPGIENPREIIRWAFYDGNKVGEVSGVFDVGGAYVVAVLTNLREKGTIPLEQIKENLRSFVMNRKKGEYVQNKLSGQKEDIYKIASSYNSKVDTNQNLTFSSRNIPGFGSEFDVIGHVFSMKSGEQSDPIIGNGAVFVVMLDKFIEPPQITDYSIYRQQDQTTFDQRVKSNYMLTALQDKSDIEDNRRLFY